MWKKEDGLYEVLFAKIKFQTFDKMERIMN